MSPVSMPDAAQKPFNVLLDTRHRQLLERERERRGLRSWGEVVRAMIDAKTGANELRALIDALTRRAVQSTKELPCPSDKS